MRIVAQFSRLVILLCLPFDNVHGKLKRFTTAQVVKMRMLGRNNDIPSSFCYAKEPRHPETIYAKMFSLYCTERASVNRFTLPNIT